MAEIMPRSPVDGALLGEEAMRSNSGKDEGRNNLRDPTMRDHDRDRGDTAAADCKPKAPADQRVGRKD